MIFPSEVVLQTYSTYLTHHPMPMPSAFLQTKELNPSTPICCIDLAKYIEARKETQPNAIIETKTMVTMSKKPLNEKSSWPK